MICFLRRRL
jgi:aspartyl-tRNA(Asn)/glutamyl-tRNA(Gln) amidotransferase subunit A